MNNVHTTQRKCWWRPIVECGNCDKLGSIEHLIVLVIHGGFTLAAQTT